MQCGRGMPICDAMTDKYGSKDMERPKQAGGGALDAAALESYEEFDGKLLFKVMY
jgi:hypothetical protein